MSDDDSVPRNPFEGMPFFADMMRAMAAQGPLNWDLATQFAALGARGDDPDPDPSPTDRLEWNRLAEIADMRVRDTIGAAVDDSPRTPEVLTVTRAAWAHRTLGDMRPVFNDLAAALSRGPAAGSAEPDDPMSAMLGNLTSMIAPAMIGMSIGSMVGALARHAFGQYDLPLPRPSSRELLVIDSSVSRFADEWSIARDDLRMWVLVHELASHSVLATPAAVEGLSASVSAHVAAFRPDPSAILERLGDLDPTDPSALARAQETLSDPMVVLGALRSPEQERLAPILDARVAALQGYVDWVVDTVSARLLGSSSPIAEAVRRRRLEYGNDATLIERLLGLTLSRAQLHRGRAFIDGVVERDGESALTLMLNDPESLPTPNEVDAPGLWLARLEVQ
jgi:putative hydrolase